MSNSLASIIKKRDREIPAHLTYLIAETLVDKVPTTAVRDYGLGERNPETLPGRKLNSESVNANRVHSEHWDSMRRTANSIAWIGHKY